MAAGKSIHWGGDRPKAPSIGARGRLEAKLEPFVGSRVAFVGSPIAFVGSRMAFVGSRNAFVGSRRRIVGSRTTKFCRHRTHSPGREWIRWARSDFAEARGFWPGSRKAFVLSQENQGGSRMAFVGHESIS